MYKCYSIIVYQHLEFQCIVNDEMGEGYTLKEWELDEHQE